MFILDKILESFQNTYDYLANYISDLMGYGYNKYKDPLYKDFPSKPSKEWLKGSVNGHKINKEYSRKLTNLFENTKVNVIEVYAGYPNAWTFPGAPETSNFMEYPFITEFLPFAFICQLMERIENGVKDVVYNGGKCVYNPKTNKLNLSVKEVTVYVTTRLLNDLSNKEVIAVLLHEVGHNTQTAVSVIEQLGSLILLLMFLRRGVPQLLDYYNNIKTNYDNNNQHVKGVLTTILFFISTLLLLMFIKYMPTFLRLRQEIYSDEFAIKCGYGKEMESATRKLNEFTKLSIDYAKRAPSMNETEKITLRLHIFKTKLIDFISSLWLGNYPSMDNREKLIKAKTDAFSKDTPLDRSGKIDYQKPDYNLSPIPVTI